MIPLALRKNSLPGLLLTTVALLVIIGTAKYFFSWNVDALDSPVFLIYPINHDFGDTEKEKLRSLLQLDPDDPNLHELEEEDTLIIKDIPGLLTQLDNNSGEIFQAFHFFKLDTPSSFSKKGLRHMIEESFTGKRRVEALRRVIVVLDLDAVYPNSTQDPHDAKFKEDLIYIRDNFGGVGLLLNVRGEDRLKNLGNGFQSISSTLKAFYY